MTGAGGSLGPGWVCGEGAGRLDTPIPLPLTSKELHGRGKEGDKEKVKLEGGLERAGQVSGSQTLPFPRE